MTSSVGRRARGVLGIVVVAVGVGLVGAPACNDGDCPTGLEPVCRDDDRDCVCAPACNDKLDCVTAGVADTVCLYDDQALAGLCVPPRFAVSDCASGACVGGCVEGECRPWCNSGHECASGCCVRENRHGNGICLPPDHVRPYDCF